MTAIQRISDAINFAIAPVWNHAQRMQEITRWLMRFFILAVVLSIFIWLSHQPVFTLKHLQIESAGHQDLKHVHLPAVRAQVLDKVQGNFFSVRLQDVKDAFEALPWVRHASVRRAWPNGLIVSIEEQKPLGVWGKADQQKLLNVYGEVFDGSVAELDENSPLIEFSGPDGSSKEVLRLYQKASTWFKPWDAEVKSLTLSDRYAWHIKLSNGVRIEFGREEEQAKGALDQRVAQLLQYWPQVQQKWPNRVDAVDLRYPNGFAVHIVGAPTKTSAPAIKVEIPKAYQIAILSHDEQRIEEWK
ncbi:MULTISPECIES: cell division protein FtsQ/DivIB [unclassified Polynucleobacter]|uniref:cell division protein FtsQ/DivIB n=1 Tax=unclassified Polynucleobacter TaxID=2640945 RepID=UPI0025731D11|nr:MULTISPECIES: cell division protein FtsQ/DivIB [unclassified Polynucleobacter]BEI42011.1 cell division protein FtsQ/DivIB [Polynucleobacter sp. HIN10]BEI43788.1 cell division protein FtsQ/DivIB [Polynucleobacter sp. HIN11]